jgi:hypothetical protein
MEAGRESGLFPYESDNFSRVIVTSFVIFEPFFAL